MVPVSPITWVPFRLSLTAGYAESFVALPSVEQANMYSKEIEHFVECLETDSVPLTNGRDAARTVAVILALYASAETQRAEAVPLPF